MKIKILLSFIVLVLLPGCFLGINKPDGTPATQPSDVPVPSSVTWLEENGMIGATLAGCFGIPFAGLTREWLKNKGLSKAFKDVVSTVQSAKVELDKKGMAEALSVITMELSKQDKKRTQKLVKKAKETKDV